jgi:hypothetical protein
MAKSVAEMSLQFLWFPVGRGNFSPVAKKITICDFAATLKDIVATHQKPL